VIGWSTTLRWDWDKDLFFKSTNKIYVNLCWIYSNGNKLIKNDLIWAGLIDYIYTLKIDVYKYLRTLQCLMNQVREIFKIRDDRVKCQFWLQNHDHW
jgi:uncharacterized membrane protein